MVETYIPSAGQVCSSTITAVPEILLSPIAFYYRAGTPALVYCGRNNVYWLAFQATTIENSVLSCFKLTTATGAWTKSTAPSKFDHPTNFPIFSYNNRIWVVDDQNPEVYDVANDAWQLWDSAKNPSISADFTRGGGCAVVASDYVYWFAGKVVRRMSLKGMPSTDGLRVWEKVADLTDTATSNCVVLPTNRNQIMVEVRQFNANSYGTTIFDIYSNTFTPVLSPTDLTGAPLTEICRSANPVPLYAFPGGFYGSGVAKVYTPAGPAVWPDLTTAASAGSISVGRSFPAVTLLPKAFSGLTVPDSCTAGC